MPTMNGAPDPDTLDYVRATARLLELPLADDQASRVALQLMRTRALAATLASLPMRPDDDIAEIYRVAPFPDRDPHSDRYDDTGNVIDDRIGNDTDTAAAPDAEPAAGASA